MTIERFFTEIGTLKEMQRTGWVTIGIHEGDSVAAHSHRVAVITYYLAKKVGADVNKAVLMALIHDISETRTWDVNRVMKGYVKVDEDKAIDEIFPKELEELKALAKETEKRESLESKIVKDADALDMIIQAKTYMERGNERAKDFLTNGVKLLHMKESKQLAKQIIKQKKPWWDGLKNF